MEIRECPMCGEVMRVVIREGASRVPGTVELRRTRTVEWVCPECDHFEEADERDSA